MELRHAIFSEFDQFKYLVDKVLEDVGIATWPTLEDFTFLRIFGHSMAFFGGQEGFENDPEPYGSIQS